MPEPMIANLSVDPTALLERVARACHVRVSDIQGPRRRQRQLQARHLAMYVFRQIGWSYPEIGRFFGRDHTTVMSAVRKVEATTSAEALARFCEIVLDPEGEVV